MEVVMPVYEYHCLECKKKFSVYVTVAEHEKHEPPKCSGCGSTKVKQLFEDVWVVTSKKS